MAEFFNRIRPGYELVKVKFQWNVQVPFIHTADGNGEKLRSSYFSSQKTPNSKWALDVIDSKSQITIDAYHYDYALEKGNFVEPTLVKLSILNKREEKVLQKILEFKSTKFLWSQLNDMRFYFSKKEIIKSKCQQLDGSLTFSCKILTHVKMEPTSSSADPSVFTVDCTGGLSSHLEELFNDKQFSDVILNIRGREFPAHKNILATRSEVFAAMFQHPMKEKATNHIEIEDIEPEVFQELLRFIYTGRLSLTSMETMATGLFIAADKYLLEELKMKCENYLVHHMSPNNCVVLLLHGDLQNPAEPLKEAAKYLRRFPNEVMATDGWKKIKQENPALLCDIQQFAFCFEY